jgi:transcriptional regulator with XRE-family HTH domain
MTIPTVVLATEPVIRPPLRFAHYRLVAFPIVLRREREARGLRRAALADAAGLTVADLIDLENGAAQPALDVVFALADVLGTDAADLLHETRREAEGLVVDTWGERRRLRAREPRRGP